MENTAKFAPGFTVTELSVEQQKELKKSWKERYELDEEKARKELKKLEKQQKTIMEKITTTKDLIKFIRGFHEYE